MAYTFEEDEDIWWDREDYTEKGQKLAEVLGGLEPFEMAEELMRFIAKQDSEVMHVMLGRWNFEVIAYILTEAQKKGLDKYDALLNAGNMLSQDAQDVMKERYPREDRAYVYDEDEENEEEI